MLEDVMAKHEDDVRRGIAEGRFEPLGGRKRVVARQSHLEVGRGMARDRLGPGVVAPSIGVVQDKQRRHPPSR